MTYPRAIILSLAVLSLTALTACGGRDIGRVVGGTAPPQPGVNVPSAEQQRGSTIWDIFRPKRTENVVNVNKYIWNASLDVLSFLPIESVDPFTGVIDTGYGVPPGGGRAYRATIYISDPALEARSLNVAIQTAGGRPADAATQRAVEDAILARARQLRARDSRF